MIKTDTDNNVLQISSDPATLLFFIGILICWVGGQNDVPYKKFLKLFLLHSVSKVTSSTYSLLRFKMSTKQGLSWKMIETSIKTIIFAANMVSAYRKMIPESKKVGVTCTISN